MGRFDDDDIKIAGQEKAASLADSAEETARLFLQHKNSGNIEKARQLGKNFATAIIRADNSPLWPEGPPVTQREYHQKLLLYSYIVNRVIAEDSPNSLLAQTSLNVFYSEIESSSKKLHQHVSDMAAFSLYILCERSPSRDESEIGSIYADLCDYEGDQRVIVEGNAFYRRMLGYCRDKIREIGYA